MNAIDYAVIAFYFAAVIAIGFWYQRRASTSLDSYFLGGKSMHWLALAMSGAVSNFDISGTMWIVTLLTLFGMKSMWNHWMWGFLMGAFFLSYMGKWVRRSNVMTGAEWMVTRFGSGRDGWLARISYTLMAVVTLTAFVGYGFQGIGKFASVYFDLRPAAGVLCELFPRFSESIRFCAEHEIETLAVIVFAVTTLYVLLGGLYSVVITNVIQTAILTVASIVIAVVAYQTVGPDTISRILPDGWTSLWPSWRLAEPERLVGTGYEAYQCFGALVIVWVVKGLLLNLGGPGQMYDFQTFLAARDPRDAAKLGAAWSGFLVVRWAMAMGIALLALAGIEGVADPEQVMPVVLKTHLAPGVRGLVIAGLLAAFMSTFSATVNAAASYVVRDLWQPLVFPRASQKHLVRAGYATTLAVVLAGTLIGLSVQSIGAIFSWIMMELGAAFVIPNVLRWHWWRLSGRGYAIGTLLGLAAAVCVPLLSLVLPGYTLPLWVTFPAICCVSLLGCLIGTWMGRPTDEAVLISFYENIRPFGAWAPIRRKTTLSPEQLRAVGEGPGRAIANVVIAAVGILAIYLFPMYLVGHWHMQAAICLGLAAATTVALWFTWYRHLPKPEP